MYKQIIKPFFFLFKPEIAHHISMSLLNFITTIPGIREMVRSMFRYHHPALEREVFGLRFRNPVGLAAGFDKDGKYAHAMSALGFGFIEIGTVTPKAQPGNPRPRLFRLPPSEGLINRMGFNNDGAEALAERLQKRGKPDCIVGGNIGKNKVTPNELAHEDYRTCFHVLYPFVDYFVVNVSSPNTPGLRELQEKEPLQALLRMLQEENRKMATPKPILLKIAPDLTDSQLDDIIQIVGETELAGVIATNTTIARDHLREPAEVVEAIGAGGLSGKPLKDRATEVIRYLSEKSGGAFPIIGVGGIQHPEDAEEKLRAGASLVQIYTGMVYEGPGIVRRINKYLASHPQEQA